MCWVPIKVRVLSCALQRKCDKKEVAKALFSARMCLVVYRRVKQRAKKLHGKAGWFECNKGNRFTSV